MERVEEDWAAIGALYAHGQLDHEQLIRTLFELDLIRKTLGPEPGANPAVTYLETGRERPLVPGPRFAVQWNGQGYLCVPVGVRARWDTGPLSFERPVRDERSADEISGLGEHGVPDAS